MKKYLSTTLLLLLSVFLIGCSMMSENESDEHGAMGENHDAMMEEHHGEDNDVTHEMHANIHHNVPETYSGKTNPLADDSEAIAAGKVLYSISCAACHGETGKGDGLVSSTLDPKPASLSDTGMMTDLGDDYLYWRISEGGTGIIENSDMPPWKEIYTEEETWQLVSYIRTLGK